MTPPQTSKSWMICPQPNGRAKLRLFCFHHAGGGAWNYRTWPDQLPASIELCAVELPGRGFRLTETPFTHLDALVRPLADALMPYFDKPFVFFGHSMGGLVSFELTRFLRRNFSLKPRHLFISGHRAPQLPDHDPPLHQLPEPQFLEELRTLEGTPEAVLENAELMQLLLPTLRADFRVVETYTYTPELPFNFPITAFGGWQDRKVSYDELNAWQAQTQAGFSLQMFPGNHFFLHAAQSDLLQYLSQDLHHLVNELTA